MVALEKFAEMFGVYALELTRRYGLVFTILAIVGLISIISAIGQKAMSFGKICFYILAIPLIIIVGLINRKHRSDRLKELGEIRAYLKEKPEKWKSILFKVIIVGMFIAGIVVIITVSKSIIPILQSDAILRSNETLWNITL